MIYDWSILAGWLPPRPTPHQQSCSQCGKCSEFRELFGSINKLMTKNHKKTQQKILVHVVTLGTFWGALKTHENNSILFILNDLVNALTIVISGIRPFNTVPSTYMWPVVMSAIFLHTRFCCTWTVQTPGWALHKIDIPILLCVSGVSLGLASSINNTSPCMARHTTRPMQGSKI